MVRGTIVIVAVLITTVLLLAQSYAGDIKKTVSGTVDIQKSMQKRQDKWAEEQAVLEARYRTAKGNVEYLGDRKAVLEKKSRALDESIAELERRMEESTRLQNNLQDTLNVILERLEDFIGRDLPFLIKERNARIMALKRELVQPGIQGAEKLRRLLEALQVETMYGGTVEVEPERIVVEGDTVFVDVLRVGRVSVFWRTPDGKEVGEFDRAGGKWVRLSDKYGDEIGYAMDMAARIRPVELIELPIGRIQP